MSFSQENGYTPETISQLMNQIRLNINAEFGTSYTPTSFVGTNFYKFVYSIAQKIQQNEIKTSEIFLKYQEYIQITNEKIQRPSVSYPGLLDSFASRGFVASTKKMLEADAGKIFICVDTDETDPDYPEVKAEIGLLISQFVAAGLVYQGDQVESIVLSNGQEFDFAFALPDRTPILLRMTATISDNNLLAIPDDEAIRQRIFDQINLRYRLGWNFEPQRYYNLSDAPWASNVLLEYSDDAGATWESGVFVASYIDLFTFGLDDIAVVIS